MASCSFNFRLEGSGMLQPAVRLSYADGSKKDYSESFASERQLPDLQLTQLAIEMEDGQQYLVASFDAQDDVDLSYLSISFTGLRASDLRAAGGVVSQAESRAFLRMPEAVRIYPSADGQSRYSLRQRIEPSLSAEEVARNALVMVQATAVDASGNQSSYSDIRFTGESVDEAARSISVSPGSLIFSDALQSARLIPEVDFEFRGPTPLAGLGQGVSYRSSSPEKVWVSAEGVVYPLQETAGEAVFVYLNYPGLAEISLPVKVDFSRRLTSLKFNGQASGQPLVLSRLNEFQKLPPLLAVFDDGSEAPLADSLVVEMRLPDGSEGVLESNERHELLARAQIPDQSPLTVHLNLQRYPDIGVDLPVAAEDAAPSVDLQPPASIAVGSVLELAANATDDVAVKGVEFWLDGSLVGRRVAPPYALSLPIEQELEGRELHLRVVAFDSAGNSQSSPERTVRVVAKSNPTVPAFTFETPVDAQRVVENSQIRAVIAASLGVLPDVEYQSGISRVEYFMDGRKVGETLFPVLEQRPLPSDPNRKELFELWLVDLTVPDIAVRETSLALSARVYSRNGGVKDAPARLLRVLQNQRPTARITQPAVGSLATVGQTVTVTVEASDDTLDAGTDLFLQVNGEEVQSYRHQVKNYDGNAFGIRSATHSFQLPIKPEWLGTTLELRARVVDQHEQSNLSEKLLLPVKGDQLPTVSLSHPVEGMHLVSGQPVELRANATDDLGMRQVDFFVNGKLVGTDLRAPFAVVYQTPQGVVKEAPLAIHAEATDSAGQLARSAVVNVTLGKDEEQPVLNLASPSINVSDAGKDLAPVVENSTFVLKLTGYDNVGVERLDLYGVAKRDGVGYVLTGDPQDHLSNVDGNLTLQSIPGTLKAFSALKVVAAPAFKHLDGVRYDTYPIRAIATDGTGNTSELQALIGIQDDAKPRVRAINPTQSRVYSQDDVVVEVIATDDIAVHALEASLWQDGGAAPLWEKRIDAQAGLTPGPETVNRLTIPLKPLALGNQNRTLRLRVAAVDDGGQRGDVANLDVPVMADVLGPRLAVLSPIQGAPIYAGNTISMKVRGVDDTRLVSLRALAGARTLYSVDNLAVATYEQSFTVTVPEQGDELVVELRGADQYGNEAEPTFWRFPIERDQPPLVSVRAPAPGARLYEGESFNAQVLAQDDRKLTRVEFFLRQGGQTTVLRAFTGSELNQDQGSYLSASLRVPNKAAAGDDIGVRAFDSANQVTEAMFELDIVDDTEAPTLQMNKPIADFSLEPGKSFDLQGSAGDNQYVDAIDAVLIDSQTREEHKLPWEIFSRKDRVETVKIPNPGTLGSIIAGQRFYADFDARLRLTPELSRRYAGQVLQLVVRARDRGVNETRSKPINIKVLADETGPRITIQSPSERLFERQTVELRASLQDETAVASYEVRLLDDQGRDEVLAQASNLSAADVAIPQGAAVTLDIARYRPQEEPVALTLVIKAKDLLGNESQQTRRLLIQRDLPPKLAWRDGQPNESQQRGQPLRGTLTVTDDFSSGTSQDAVDHLLVISSLRELGGAARDIQGLTRQESQPARNRARISLAYPEAQGWQGGLLLNGKAFVQVQGDRLLLDGGEESQQPRSLQVGDQTGFWTMETYSRNLCQVRPATREIEAPNGLLALDTLFNTDTTRLVLRPRSGIPGFIRGIQFSLQEGVAADLPNANGARVPGRYAVNLLLQDGVGAGEQVAFLQLANSANLPGVDQRYSLLMPIPADVQSGSVTLFGHAIDRLSAERGEQVLQPLLQQALGLDEIAPTAKILSPVVGSVAIPLQQLDMKVEFDDDSRALKSLRLLENRSRTIHDLGVTFGQRSWQIPYRVPKAFDSGELELTLIAEDWSGRSTEHSMVYPLQANEKPELAITGFNTYWVNGVYKKALTEPARINYGEFWVRTNEKFRLDTRLRDDAGLAAYRVQRLKRDGSVAATVYERTFPAPCPQPAPLSAEDKTEILFDQTEPTEYRVELVDTYGHVAQRTLLIHPLVNVVPEVRITAPAEEQDIAAGTFRIRVGLVAADDRFLSSDRLKVFANGVPLPILSSASNTAAGGDKVVEAAFLSIHDSFAANYDADIAADFGRMESPYALQRTFVLEVPQGLIRYNEKLKLTAQITDSDGAVGLFHREFNVAADTIAPKAAITRPGIGFGAIEDSDFTVGVQALDNVKVNRITVSRAYSVLVKGEAQARIQDFVQVRNIEGIPADDYKPVSTVDIDTPEYTQVLHVDRLQQILDGFGVTHDQVSAVEVWVKVDAYDVANSYSTRVSYPVRVDERPVLDVVEPLAGAKVVEGNPLYVNVKAFDDVGIEYVHLRATYGNGQQPYEMRLRTAPYNFSVPMSVFDPANPAANRVHLSIEAVDTYGVAHNDLDKHRAEEGLDVEIVQDQAPSVVIGTPKDGSQVIEGQLMLVQVNAVDDVGIDRVVLNVAGLKGGDRSFTDLVFPYEFLVEIPYGQAGTDLLLTASTLERRANGQARSVTTPRPVRVHTFKDEQPPQLVVKLPVSPGASASEKRALPYQLEVEDNVRVGSVGLGLYVDRDADGQFVDGERVADRLMITAPFFGSLPLGSIAEYLGRTDALPDALSMQLRITARDGAGNETVQNIPVTLRKNQLPEVNAIKLLDARGFAMGDVSSLTEGRGIVIQVQASDPEVGVDSASLFYSIGAADATPVYQPLGEDSAAPYQFHFKVPNGRVGQVLRLRAKARDLDGYESPMVDLPGALKIEADQAPQARIVKPDNDNSVVIDGEDVEVFVEAFDDLGPEGIDHVTFYVNGIPAYTTEQSYGQQTGSHAQDHVYRAQLAAPSGVQGFTVQAIAYDVLGQAGESQVIRIGRLEDTVVPRLSVLAPIDRDVLTMGESLRAVTSIEDMGGAIQHVYMTWQREYQDASGAWVVAGDDAYKLELFRNDERAAGDTTPVSQPDKHYFVYWADFSDGKVLRRTGLRNERVHVLTEVITPNHTVKKDSYHEIGWPLSERRYILPAPGAQASAKQVHYTAVDQYRGLARSGAMLAAWSSVDPLRIEQRLDLLTKGQLATTLPPARTGIFILDADNEAQSNQSGDFFNYSPLLNGAAEMFSGSIGELMTDENIVLASKSGVAGGACETGSVTCQFISQMTAEIRKDWVGGDRPSEGTGALYLDNDAGELLLFGQKNGDGQFGLPYLLMGRVDMPYPDVYGLTRSGNLALVANGNGGVQVIDISNMRAPYHVGYIKPNGFSRDVKVVGHYAYIAASEEGVVVADLSTPAMPIVARVDTLGIANRLHLVGNQLYVTDMAGAGDSARLSRIDISEPDQPRVVQVVEIEPNRPDLAPDGLYDVHVSGNLAYVTQLLSDQEDKPSQSLVQIIDLARVGESGLDATVPVMVKRKATADDFAVRGVTLARGAIQVAAGKGGIGRIDLPSLTILQHAPQLGENDVSTQLPAVLIELSAVLPEHTVLSDYVQVLEGDAQIGRDITAQFDLAFAARGIDTTKRRIQLTRKEGQSLLPRQRYYVRIKQGLTPVTGQPLQADYVFNFNTASADARYPDILSICTRESAERGACVNAGDVRGGTELIVRGVDFGDAPRLLVGGEPLVIEKRELDAQTGIVALYAKTVPNYPGPATVTVTNDGGLSDTVLGGFVFVDELSISHLTPAVVRVAQAGRNDLVAVVGKGFHAGMKLTAYKSGEPGSAQTFEVGSPELRLYSAERMNWLVPELRDDDGAGYRGFIDVELEDELGRRYVQRNALFYGRLQLDRGLESEPAMSRDTIDQRLRKLENGQLTDYVPDPLKLPPGNIVDLAVDSDLRMVYVLGRGELGEGVPRPNQLASLDDLKNYYAPGWLSLVKYDPARIDQAAPRHGLGYYNLPQDLQPSAMALAEHHVYVAARGYSFPFVDTEYEGRSVLLVYDREIRDPDDLGEQPPGKDRGIRYSLPLPFNEVAEKVVVHQGLAIVATRKEGVAVVSLADPLRPSVVRRITQATLDGRSQALSSISDIAVIGDTLHIVNGNRRVVFDLSKPSLPQLGDSDSAGLTALAADGSRFATGNDLKLYDASRPAYIRQIARYQSGGFSVPGQSMGIEAFATTGVNLTRAPAASEEQCEESPSEYLGFYDFSRPDNINLLDALVLPYRCMGTPNGLLTKSNARYPLLVTEQGIGVFAMMDKAKKSHLGLVDLLTLELVSSVPRDQADGVPLDSALELYFTRSLNRLSDDDLRDYLVLQREAQSGQPPETIPFALQRSDDQRVLRMLPEQQLAASSGYRIILKGDLASRRTRGLMEHTVRFRTGLAAGPRVAILGTSPSTLDVSGGPLTVVLSGVTGQPQFSVSGQVAQAALTETRADGTALYTVQAPASTPGAASLQVISGNGSKASKVGAVQYVEPLLLRSLAPAQGSFNGGTRVLIKGQGFRADPGAMTILFGDTEATQYKVLDAETLEVITPASSLGTVDVQVTLSGNAQQGTLPKAFTYQQPPQSLIRDTGRV
ncbi:Ig-like domain-containing protein [Pseudomonas indica]|uniref:Ig-like domain-containing protein n=1 Tax=Pseudomonas indica TaxID=137658 RepID=UPI003FD3954F